MRLLQVTVMCLDDNDDGVDGNANKEARTTATGGGSYNDGSN